jgi:hypothetical protein
VPLTTACNTKNIILRQKKKHFRSAINIMFKLSFAWFDPDKQICWRNPACTTYNGGCIKMQLGKLGKLVAAGSMATIMMGSSIALAQLQKYPAPFVQDGSADTLIVVGLKAAPSDIAGAIDVAARLGGERTTDVVVSGAVGGLSISGEGKDLSTANTKIYLNDYLGKTGLRTTLTKDDLTTILANGILDDADAGTTHNYQQFIYMTPSANNAYYRLDFEKPGTGSNVDPTFNFGSFPTAPTSGDYFYKTYVTFDKDVNGTTAVGEKLTLFGNTYTVSSGTTFQESSATNNKLVLFGGAQTQTVAGSETIKVVVSGVSYDVTLVGATGTTTAVIQVGSDTSSITKGSSKKVGGLDVYVDDVYYLSQNDQTANRAKLLLGSAKMTLQHGSKVKLGDTEDSQDGTLVNLTTSAGKLSALTVYSGARSSTDDHLALGGTFVDKAWKTFGVSFPAVSPALTDPTRDTIKFTPSGDNILRFQYTDERGYKQTLDYAYKASSTGTTMQLADSSGNGWTTVEGQAMDRNDYFVVDAGDFTHLFQLTGVSIDGTASSNIEITDKFSGVTTKVTLGTDNAESKVIDGQTYFFNTTGTSAVYVTWGSSASNGGKGDFVTVWPRLKGQNGEFLTFTNNTYTPQFTVATGTKIQLPTGAISLTYNAGQTYTIAAADKEDGSTSVLTGDSVVNLTASSGDNATFSLGKTATGAVWYDMQAGTVVNTTMIGLLGAQTGSTTLGNATALLVEAKDDDGNQYSVMVPSTIEASGSNNVAIPSSPLFTWTAPSAQNSARGSDSTITDYIDKWGTWVVKTTSGQDTITVYYPQDQVLANVAVLASDATAMISEGATGKTVATPVPFKSALGVVDNELTSAQRTGKNLILVGGPLANSVVSDLATAGKTRATQHYLDQGPGYFLLDYVANAFGQGKAVLVVAGYAKEETRSACLKLENFDTAGLTGARAEFKSGVLTTLPA